MFIKKLSSCIRYYCTKIKKPYLITTPIFYVNASPHIGHLYSAIIADTVFRFENLLNKNNLNVFSTGTDEHGIKIQQAAIKNNCDVKSYCDKISKEYKILFHETNVGYSDFIRTSEKRHKKSVSEFWNLLQSKNHIYSANYSGWYCVPDETFLTESQLKLLDNGQRLSIESGHPVEWTEETNYMFRLGLFQNDIIYWLKQSNRIKPLKFEKLIMDWLEEPLNDLSISRPTSRVHWGIRVPGDETQTVYVWLDALVNYLTVTGYPTSKIWPPNLQVIGKDILKFHGIYWPAFLIAAGFEPPEQLLVHSHWTVDGVKMSKSKMNVVDPMERMKTYTAEGLRYFLLREGVAHSDGNYSDVKVLRILNSELADTFGNLLSRCCAKSLNPKQIVPNIDETSFNELKKLDVLQKLLQQADEVVDKSFSHYKSYNFYLVVDNVISLLHTCNNFVETTKPWELKKQTNLNEIKKLQTILSITMEILRISGIILQPIIPKLTEKLLDKLNILQNERCWKDLKYVAWNMDNKTEKPLGSSDSVLFRRIVLEEKQRIKKN